MSIPIHEEELQSPLWKRLGLPNEAFAIVLTFFLFRVMLLATFRPDDLLFYSDYSYYFDLASRVNLGQWPYLHYWMEHPPVFSFLSSALAWLVRGLPTETAYRAYAYILLLLMICVSVGTLILMLKIAQQLYGEAVCLRLGWSYSLLFTPLIFTYWNFEPLTAFFVLWALWAYLAGRERQSAIFTALGILTKIMPLLILPAVMRARALKRWVWYVGLSLGLAASVYGCLFLISPQWTAASLSTYFNRNSYETVWALLDGNLSTGVLGPAEWHFDLARAQPQLGKPPVLPSWINFLLLAITFLVLWWRVGELKEPRKFIAFYALTFVLFFLFNRGWSPQWQLMLIPLLLLAKPDLKMLVFILLFTFVNLIEFPIAFTRELASVVYLTVIVRTIMLIVLGLDLWGVIRTT